MCPASSNKMLQNKADSQHVSISVFFQYKIQNVTFSNGCSFIFLFIKLETQIGILNFKCVDTGMAGSPRLWS